MSALTARPARSRAHRDGSKSDAFEATTNVTERSSTAAVNPKTDTRPSRRIEIFWSWSSRTVTPKPTCSM